MTHSGKYRIVCSRFEDTVLEREEKIAVIDNLRASATIVTALSAGVDEIIPVVDDSRAFALAQQGCLTIGEKGGLKIEGYGISNSPVELLIKLQEHSFKKIAIKTSNLIPLLLKLPHAYICSSLNLSSTAGALLNNRVCIIAAGGENGIVEDTGTAFGLAAKLCGIKYDKGVTANFTSESNAAGNLKKIGCSADVDFISRIDVYDLVAYYDGEVVRRM